MKKIIIIGGSKGIGNAIVQTLVDKSEVINISRSPSEIIHNNLSQYQYNVLEDELPEIGEVDSLIYCPGSINLKPISRLSLEDFKDDFNINVLGAVRVIQNVFTSIKKRK